ncbi:MAG: DUF4160 domain-containing protein [Aliidiomarina sp.]|uniref:type II toxin-antitoxin system toxin DhiT n=1 Tax=Aliidiomarina sp. TaxID=1872439 RepID=UPI0025BFC6B0|nr:DUF4160 domain-containing protein [Aliidiomarina sp.]MCH8500761.1 DUF4160 domain-containing protein [Aliidiomarina sp.]
MPEIDAWLGLSFRMYFFDIQQHAQPHVHVCYGEYELVIAIQSGENLAGYLPSRQRRRAEQHIKKHRVQLLAMWGLAVIGVNPGKLGAIC